MSRIQSRIQRSTMFMEFAKLLAQRSTCVRGQVGAVIVKDRRVVSMGYNGAPPGMSHCLDVGCEGTYDEEGKHVFPDGCQRAIHAEVNAIAWAARHGISTEEATVYCTHGPCPPCARLMLAAGIDTLYYIHPYRLPGGLALLDKGRVITYQMPEN